MYEQSAELGSKTRGAMVRGDDILTTSVLKIGAATALIIAGGPEKKTAAGIRGGGEDRSL